MTTHLELARKMYVPMGWEPTNRREDSRDTRDPQQLGDTLLAWAEMNPTRKLHDLADALN